MIQQMLAIWSLVLLPFLNPVWTPGSSQLMYYWSLAWRILSITLLVCEMSAIVWYFEQSLVLEWKLTLSSPVATAEFSKYAGILSVALSQYHLLGFESQRWRSSIQSAKARLGADCGSDHELLIAKFRLKLKKLWKTTRPFRPYKQLWKEEKWKAKEKRKDIPIWMQSSKE